MKRIRVIVISAAAAVLLSSCSMHLGLSQMLGGSTSSSPAMAKSAKATHTPPASPNSVSIINAKYRPKNLRVKAGTTLTWVNSDLSPQSVTSDTPGLFDSGELAPGATWSFTFRQAGTFPYHSTKSSSSFGSITVTP
jgi:plastocyanin